MKKQQFTNTGKSFNLRWTVLVIICVLFAVPASRAQDAGKLNLAFRPSANFPLQKLGNMSLNAGGGFEATLSYQFIPKLGVYGGWGWNKFNPEQNTPSLAHFEETGYRIGMQYSSPLSMNSKLILIASAGAVANHIETENDEGDVVDDSGHGPGWEVDAGLSIPLSDHWRITPSVRYHMLPSEVESSGQTSSVHLSYLSVGVSVVWILK